MSGCRCESGVVSSGDCVGMSDLDDADVTTHLVNNGNEFIWRGNVNGDTEIRPLGKDY